MGVRIIHGSGLYLVKDGNGNQPVTWDHLWLETTLFGIMGGLRTLVLVHSEDQPVNEGCFDTGLLFTCLWPSLAYEIGPLFSGRMGGITFIQVSLHYVKYKHIPKITFISKWTFIYSKTFVERHPRCKRKVASQGVSGSNTPCPNGCVLIFCTLWNYFQSILDQIWCITGGYWS